MSLPIAEYDYSYVVPKGGDEYETRTGKRTGKNQFLTEDIKMIEYPGEWWVWLRGVA